MHLVWLDLRHLLLLLFAAIIEFIVIVACLILFPLEIIIVVSIQAILNLCMIV